jgi:hypothetical protein
LCLRAFAADLLCNSGFDQRKQHRGGIEGKVFSNQQNEVLKVKRRGLAGHDVPGEDRMGAL